jgi:hypothetical protein
VGKTRAAKTAANKTWMKKSLFSQINKKKKKKKKELNVRTRPVQDEHAGKQLFKRKDKRKQKDVSKRIVMLLSSGSEGPSGTMSGMISPI